MTIVTDYGYLSGEKPKPAVRLKWLKYTWRVLLNLFYLAVISFVFMSIHNDQTQIMAAIGGLLWVAIRSSAIGQWFGTTLTLSALAKEVDEINRRLKGQPVDKASFAQADDVIAYYQVKMMIDVCFMGLTSLICLFQFFTAL
jgi:hypothetical protein